MEKKRIIIVLVALLVLGVILFLIFGGGNKTEKMNDLKVTYSDGEVMKYGNFKKGFTDERTITVENTSNENKTFSLECSKVSNKLKEQNKFTYEIKCTGDRCAELGKSQIPVAGAIVYPQVLIEAGKKQVYTIKLTYTGSEDASFTGSLKVYSEKVDEAKIKEQETKEREKMEKQLEKEKKTETSKAKTNSKA